MSDLAGGTLRGRDPEQSEGDTGHKKKPPTEHRSGVVTVAGVAFILLALLAILPLRNINPAAPIHLSNIVSYAVHYLLSFLVFTFAAVATILRWRRWRTWAGAAAWLGTLLAIRSIMLTVAGATYFLPPGLSVLPEHRILPLLLLPISIFALWVWFREQKAAATNVKSEVTVAGIVLVFLGIELGLPFVSLPSAWPWGFISVIFAVPGVAMILRWRGWRVWAGTVSWLTIVLGVIALAVESSYGPSYFARALSFCTFPILVCIFVLWAKRQDKAFAVQTAEVVPATASQRVRPAEATRLSAKVDRAKPTSVSQKPTMIAASVTLVLLVIAGAIVFFYHQPARLPAISLSADQERALKPKDTLRECANCPEMVVVPAGSFQMGSTPSEVGRNEKPQHTVTIGQPFAVGRVELTFDEWDACIAAGGCRYNPSDGWGSRGRRPVIDVSWDDAKTYVAWLTEQTGKPYRLLSEAEYEYSARAGTQTAYPWGKDIGNNNANCKGCFSQWNAEQTVPVGSFKPNAFGLSDMVGNVWEWVEDCYHDNYDNAPTDGSAWITGGDCKSRVIRGGAWTSRFLPVVNLLGGTA
jgi:formylglycine-generating enzyme required for sulfatase activity